MVWFGSRQRETSALQSTLDAQGTGTMEVTAGDEIWLEPVQLPGDVLFGPYNVSPARGLHFDAANDTAAS